MALAWVSRLHFSANWVIAMLNESSTTSTKQNISKNTRLTGISMDKTSRNT